MPTFHVRAHWDAKASVWWAESDDIPGLVAEAASHDALVAELKLVIPEVLAMNVPSVAGQASSFRLVSDQVEELRAA